MSDNRNTRRVLKGTVVSTHGRQTIVVEVERTYRHPRYGKFVRHRKRYMAHDPAEAARPGDYVEVAATRPISKRKRWRLVGVLTHSELVEASLSPDSELAEAAASDLDAGSEGTSVSTGGAS